MLDELVDFFGGGAEVIQSFLGFSDAQYGRGRKKVCRSIFGLSIEADATTVVGLKNPFSPSVEPFEILNFRVVEGLLPRLGGSLGQFHSVQKILAQQLDQECAEILKLADQIPTLVENIVVGFQKQLLKNFPIQLWAVPYAISQTLDPIYFHAEYDDYAVGLRITSKDFISRLVENLIQAAEDILKVRSDILLKEANTSKKEIIDHVLKKVPCMRLPVEAGFTGSVTFEGTDLMVVLSVAELHGFINEEITQRVKEKPFLKCADLRLDCRSRTSLARVTLHCKFRFPPHFDWQEIGTMENVESDTESSQSMKIRDVEYDPDHIDALHWSQTNAVLPPMQRNKQEDKSTEDIESESHGTEKSASTSLQSVELNDNYLHWSNTAAMLPVKKKLRKSESKSHQPVLDMFSE